MDRFQISLSHQTRQDLLLLLGIIALAALILGGIAFSRPITNLVSEEVFYQHQGEFNYTAPDQTGIYDANRINTGDPIYTRLNCVLELKYRYQFSVLGEAEVDEDLFSGTYEIMAEVRDIDGWNRSIVLLPEQEFTGNRFATWTVLDVCQAQSLLIEKVQKTRIDNRSYNLLVYPRVKVFGSVEGVTVEDIHAPEISFQLDNEKMRLQPGIEGLELDQSGSLMAFHEVNNVLLIFGKELSVLSARRIALIALGITLLGAVYPVWLMITEKKTALGSRIRLLYEELLVDVEMDSLIIKGSQVVSVEAFRDLVKMAQRYGAMILHETDGRLHRYTVQDENILYQYAVEETPVEEE